MDDQRRTSTGGQATMFRDLRMRNERRDRVVKLMEEQRKRRSERAMQAQMERWTRGK